MKTIFNYPVEFVTLPEYSARRGQEVEVLYRLGEADADDPDEPMYRVRAADGWEGDAFEGELEVPGQSWEETARQLLERFPR